MKKALALVMALLLAAVCAGGALAEGASISVTGSATLQVPADTATVRLGVTETATDVLEAQSAMNAKIDAVRNALIESGVDAAHINTDWMSIYTNYNYDDGAERISGYTASSTLSIVTKDIENSGAIIDVAFAAGANTLNGIDFSVEDVEPATNQAYLEAMKAARAKAELLASAENLAIGSVLSISQGSSYAYDSMSNYVRYDTAAAEGSSTFVQAALIDVSVSVSVAYELIAE